MYEVDVSDTGPVSEDEDILKPDEARDKIVALMGDVPRVELFARQSPPGWDVWGNEVESTVPDFWTKCPEVGAKGG